MLNTAIKMEPMIPLDSPEPRSQTEVPSLDAETLFSSELSQEALLTRSDEEALAKQITAARRRVRAVLRRARRLSKAALADRGRGVVLPERDFREREAIAVLQYAQAALESPAALRTTGLDRRGLRRFIAELTEALAEYRVLRDRMVRANVRLVAMLARRYRHPTLTFLDLFQEGTLGLLRAVEKYDLSRNVKFSTYASWWIWQQLGRTADTQGDLIRTPVHWNQLRRRIARTGSAAAPGSDPEAAETDAGEPEGIEPSRLETMTQAFHFISTDTASSDEDRPLESVLAGSAPDPESEALHAALGERLEEALKELPAREGFIVRQRFGLGNDDSQTLEEISTHLGVSRERVRQLESRALAKLREVCTQQGLREYLN